MYTGFTKKRSNSIFLILIMLLYAGIYLYRMFTNNPWYDELYTYYSFISKGPVYSAIHWPLPNNHIGYSALSGFLSYLGNPTIALRGVSFICAVLNIYLVYRLASEYTDEKLSFLAVFIYAGVFEVHNMAVQGRGYTLSTTCYLLAMLMIIRIINGKGNFLTYAVYSICLALGIYAVPSSTFWVIPVCIFGGIYFLFNKRIKELIYLVIASVIAALMALSLYLVIWLSIGSNLLSKDAASAYYGIYQLDIIKMNPVLSAQTGIDYMLASPYIQSMDRGTVISGLFNYFEALFEQFYGGLGIAITVFLAITGVIALVRFIFNRTRILEIFLSVSIFMLPVMLIIQSVQPYLRVFSYFGVVLSLSVIMYLNILRDKVLNRGSLVSDIFVIAMGILLVGRLFTYTYTAPMADRENDIKEAMDGYIETGFDVSSMESIYYTDDYQKYVFKFFYDIDPSESTMEEAQYVLISDTLEDPDIASINWPMLTSYDNFDFEFLNENYEEVYHTDKYKIYLRKDTYDK